MTRTRSPFSTAVLLGISLVVVSALAVSFGGIIGPASPTTQAETGSSDKEAGANHTWTETVSDSKADEIRNTGSPRESTEDGTSVEVLWTRNVGYQLIDVKAGQLWGDDRDELVFGPSDGTITTLNPTGAHQWQYSTDGWVWHVAIGDINGDGTANVIGYDHDAGNGSMYALDRTGDRLWKYTLPESGSGNEQAEHIAIADVDGDRVNEVVVGSDAMESVHVLNESGAVKWTYNTTGSVTSVRTQDLTEDGTAEVVISSSSNTDGGIGGSVEALSGAGELIWKQSFDTRVGETEFGDVNGDGRDDVVVVDWEYSATNVSTINNSGDRVLWQRTLDGEPVSLAVDDITGNATAEVVIGAAEEGISVLNGSGGTEWTYPQAGTITQVAVADISEDGALDIVASSASEKSVFVLDSSGELVWRYTGSSGYRDLAIANIDGEGASDVVVIGGDRATALSTTASSANLRPRANFTYSYRPVISNRLATFDAIDSFDRDGTIQEYHWDFDGDGDYEMTGAKASFTFTSPGNYSVTLRVTDNDGGQNSVTQTVSVVNNTDDRNDDSDFDLGQGEWPQFGANTLNMGYDPETVGPTGNITIDWQFDMNHWVRSFPAVAGNTVYVGGAGAIYALNVANGSTQWSQPIEGGPAYSGTAVSNDTVIIASHYTLYAFDASDGDERWQRSFESNVNRLPPTVRNGVLYVGAPENALYAFDVKTGEERWNVSTGGIVYTTPAVTNDSVYVGSTDDKLYAVNTTTGAEEWTRSIRRPSIPIYNNNTVYVTSGISENTSAYALNASTGDVRWQHDIGRYPVHAPALANGVLYVGERDAMYALNASDGRPLWRQNVTVSSVPAVASGVVYFGSNDGNVYGLDATSGEILWRLKTDDDVRASPAIAGGRLFIGSMDGHLYVLAGDVQSDRNSTESIA